MRTIKLKHRGRSLIIKAVSTYKSLVIYGCDKFMLKSEGDGNGRWASLYYLGDGFECNLDCTVWLNPSFPWCCDHEYGEIAPIRFIDRWSLIESIDCLYEFGIYKRGYN